ncbi:MAG: prephenate dehydratase [Magnetococcales bacterium]|nr:prephenate dehydratase [Magnetococcales bacterium]
MDDNRSIAFQGMRGAYSEQACREKMPDYRVYPCKTFEDVFSAVEEGLCRYGMLPVENSMAGVVSDSYDLLAVHRLSVVGEYFLHVRHCLLANPAATLPQITTVFSHPQALAQCRSFIRRFGWNHLSVYDTAGSAAELAQRAIPQEAAIASELCASLYGLTVLQRDIQDSRMNTTRFLVIGREPCSPDPSEPCKTSVLFTVRDIPAALYKCLGGFATNGINLTRLESRPVPGKQWTYNFYLDFQGHPEEERCRLALEELRFFTTSCKVLGCYPEGTKPQWDETP